MEENEKKSLLFLSAAAAAVTLAAWGMLIMEIVGNTSSEPAKQVLKVKFNSEVTHEGTVKAGTLKYAFSRQLHHSSGSFH